MLIEQGVDHTVTAKARGQALRHAINPAFAANILAHHHDVAVFQHQIAQRPVDQAAHRLGLAHGGEFARHHRLALGHVGPVGWAAGARWRHDAGHHLGAGGQAGLGDGLARHTFDAGLGFGVDRQRLGGAERARLAQQAHGVEQRVLGLFGLNLGAGHIGGGQVGAGMAVEADGANVQESGLAAGADVMRGFGGDAVGVVKVKPVAGEIFEAGARGKAGVDPPLRRLG